MKAASSPGGTCPHKKRRASASTPSSSTRDTTQKRKGKQKKREGERERVQRGVWAGKTLALKPAERKKRERERGVGRREE